MTNLGEGFTYVQPQFAVADLERSLAYYSEVLGFEVQWVLHDDSGKPSFANVNRDELAVFLGPSTEPNPCVLNAHADSTQFIDRVYEELLERGAIIAEPPSDRPWGLYEMRVLDPDGNMLRLQAYSDEED